MRTRPASGRAAGPLDLRFLEGARFEFGRLRQLAEAAIAQVPGGGAIHARLPPEGNSIAILMRHLAGNLRSRWTDFLTSDGEKPDRNREAEFDPCDSLGRQELLAEWSQAFSLMESALGEVTAADLGRTVRIRGEAFLVDEAIQRQIVHLAYHTGQIVLLARCGARRWESLSIPRGVAPSAAFPYKVQ